MSAPETLRLKLERAGIRPVDLARKLGVTGSMATMILKGKRNLSVWHLDAVADLLNCSVPDLFVDPKIVSSSDPARQGDGVQRATALENSTLGGSDVGFSASSDRSPLPLTGFAATEAVARLIDLRERLGDLAESILYAAAGGHTPAPRAHKSRRPRHHRPRGRTAS